MYLINGYLRIVSVPSISSVTEDRQRMAYQPYGWKNMRRQYGIMNTHKPYEVAIRQSQIRCNLFPIPHLSLKGFHISHILLSIISYIKYSKDYRTT
ncbi:hypothetical protein EYC84_003252 [Monilinia fructicola]|uniref:Uncharacterized protein n=1 Tax=Monilinia fructicola TaxID=38448 RepID=A0A5M9JVE8_MONFR|nr:hypothetical protein EYC84_003252 [Monilinia fructicola]